MQGGRPDHGALELIGIRGRGGAPRFPTGRTAAGIPGTALCRPLGLNSPHKQVGRPCQRISNLVYRAGAVKIGFVVLLSERPGLECAPRYKELREMAVAAEAAGFDSIS
jgi:hypothetical protein